MSALCILGAGGHARIVLAAARLSGVPIHGFYDDKYKDLPASIHNVPLLGGIADVPDSPHTCAVLGIGDLALRQKIFTHFSAIRWETVRHPGAYLDICAQIGRGGLLCAGSVVQTDADIGNHTIINTGATVDHDCILGENTHLSPGVHLGGNVVTGHSTWIGIGAAIIPGVHIGNNVCIGAGAVVLHDIPDNAVAVGNPAKIIKYRESL